MPRSGLEPTDSLNRSWLRRGLALPTPTWGLSVPYIWRETHVQFLRSNRVISEFGMLEAEVEYVVLDTDAHCEIVEVRAQNTAVDMPVAVVFRRKWNIFIDWPDDISKLPREGDWASFQSIDGAPIKLKLQKVYTREQFYDHVECATVEFE